MSEEINNLHHTARPPTIVQSLAASSFFNEGEIESAFRVLKHYLKNSGIDLTGYQIVDVVEAAIKMAQVYNHPLDFWAEELVRIMQRTKT